MCEAWRIFWDSEDVGRGEMSWRVLDSRERQVPPLRLFFPSGSASFGRDDKRAEKF